MFEKKRLHPIAIVTNILAEIKEFILPIIVFLFLWIKGDKINLWFLLISVSVVFVWVIGAIISWFRFVYWLEDREVRIESGVFVRKKRYIPFDRIQSISTTQGILQRLFDLVKMTIETAGGETEAVLTAIPRSDAERIQRYIKEAKKEHALSDPVQESEGSAGVVHLEAPEVKRREKVFSLSMGEVFLVAVTSGGALGVIAGVAAFASEIGEYLPLDWIFARFMQSVKNDFYTAVLIVLFALIIAYLIAIIQSMLKYAHFTVEKTDKHLIVSHGLLERRSVSIPLNRVQGFIIYEGIIRKIFGLATIALINAGISDKDEFTGEVILAPLIKRSECAGLMKKCLPEFTVDVPFTPVPARSKSRYILRPLYIVAVPVLAGLFFLKVWGFILLFLLPVLAYFGYKAYEFAGWNISGKQLVLRSRFFNARTVYVMKHRIQSLDVHRSWFQRRKQLTTIRAYILSGSGVSAGKTIDVAEEDAEKIYRWFQKERDAERNEEIEIMQEVE